MAPVNFFLQNGPVYSLTSDSAVKVHPDLPVGLYEVQFNPMSGYYLMEKNDEKPLPERLYGTVEARARRILQSYNERRERGLPTGVLLSGEKGSGKTLLARVLMQMSELPAIMVSRPYTDGAFFDILARAGRKVVLFDEFEKVYSDKGAQAALLTMLDGSYDHNNLIIATLNEAYAVHDAMKNRPSRFYYHYRYTCIEREFVEEYCQDRLKVWSPEILQQIHDCITQVFNFNFDMLQALVEEMNRFGDTPAECMRHLNIVASESSYKYALQLFKLDGEEVQEVKDAGPKEVRQRNMIPQTFEFYAAPSKKAQARGEAIYFGGDNFVGKTDKGMLVFEHMDHRAILTPKFETRSWAI
jgi:hypothetical protein